MSKEIRPNLKPASNEILDEFARVRERFLATFDPCVSPSNDLIDKYFVDHGLSKSPALSVPFSAEGAAAVRAVALETKYPLPFVLGLVSVRQDFRSPGRSGTGWTIPAYGLNIVMETDPLTRQLFGDEYADRTEPHVLGHEFGHSSFHKGTEILMEHEQGELSIYAKWPMSGQVERIYSTTRKYPGYMANWAEEAFASYIAADIFSPTLPDSKGHYLDEYIPWFGEEVPIPTREHYVNRTPHFPNDPGHMSGAVSGGTLELLDENAATAGIIDDMFGIARGEVDGEAFRKDLRKKIGNKLYGMMFTRRPYSAWPEIWHRVVFPEAYEYANVQEYERYNPLPDDDTIATD